MLEDNKQIKIKFIFVIINPSPISSKIANFGGKLMINTIHPPILIYKPYLRFHEQFSNIIINR